MLQWTQEKASVLRAGPFWRVWDSSLLAHGAPYTALVSAGWRDIPETGLRARGPTLVPSPQRYIRL